MVQKHASLFAVIAMGLTACSVEGPKAEVPQATYATKTQSVVTDCKFMDPGHPDFFPLASPIDFDRELVITDLAVVEDPCRSTWFPAGLCAAHTVGAWTFGRLMMDMAGSQPPEELVGHWLDALENGGVVNGFPVSARPNLRPIIIDPWLIDSGCAPGSPIVGPGACPLDLRRAPFRLLAIVNRVDLEGRSYGGRGPGEGRIVFGFLDAAGNPLEATVIFEYELHARMNSIQWATLWHDLSTMPLGSPGFNGHLQRVTDHFTRPGMAPGRPNRASSIGQVRTNEIDFGPDWVLREFTLQDVGAGFDNYLLLPDTVKQTPDDSLNLDPILDAFLVANEPDILNADHVVDPTFLGGESRSTFFWDNGGSAGPILPMTRHLFGFATCNGCHLVDGDARFVHIEPRSAGVASNLSNFLSATTAPGGGGFPAGLHAFTVPPSLNVRYNEPWRRTCEVTRILSGDPQPFTKANGAH